jgi:beta-galactosidase
MRVTDFLHWQAALVRECAGPTQFITTDYGGMMKRDVNEEAVAGSLDIVADNIYHGTQDHYDGSFQALQSDFSRSLKHGNFLVTETNAQTIGWTSGSQFPPYDGQMREDVYTYLAEWREHGGVLALGLDPRQPGDLLEGHSLARPGAESRIRRGEPHGA